MTEKSFERLYRKQCEDNEATWAKMNQFRIEATNLRALLVDEQNAHQRTKDIIFKAAKQIEGGSQ